MYELLLLVLMLQIKEGTFVTWPALIADAVIRATLHKKVLQDRLVAQIVQVYDRASDIRALGSPSKKILKANVRVVVVGVDVANHAGDISAWPCHDAEATPELSRAV